MKRFQIIVIFCFLCFLFINCSSNKKQESYNYEWNNGICSEDGGKLIYYGTGNKEHYRCEICGKEYSFDKIMIRK